MIQPRKQYLISENTRVARAAIRLANLYYNHLPKHVFYKF